MSTETDVDFEAAFAEAVDSQPDTTVAEVETPEPVAVEQQEPVVDEAPVVEAVVDEQQEPQEPAPVAASEPAPAPVAPAIDTAAIAAALADEQDRRQRQAQAAQKPTAEPEKAAAYSDYLDDSQKKSLEQFEAEWPEVAAPIAVLVNAHLQAALANQRKEILGQVQQQMAPIQQVTAKSQEAMYFATIQAEHPDFREVSVALPEWIEKQPAVVRKALSEAYYSPNAADAVELISMYKQAIGSTGAAPAHPASSAVQAQPKAAPVPAAAVAATLAPPTAKRSVASPSRDPNDADAAFIEAFG